MTLNKQFREQLQREPEVELEMIKESQWELEIAEEVNLLNTYSQGFAEAQERTLSSFDKHYVYYIRPSDRKSYHKTPIFGIIADLLQQDSKI